MTQAQEEVLALIRKLNEGEFASWFNPSEVMAFVQVESAFKTRAYRYEPRLGEGSYGLMQVLASTAKSVDPAITNPEVMYDPECGLRVGMKVAKLYWEQEARDFQVDPTYEEWAAAYNEGVGGVERDHATKKEPDPAYTAVWNEAHDFWQKEGVDY